MPSHPFAYPKELRAEAVRLCRQEGLSATKAAAHLGVSRPTVLEWLRAADGKTAKTTSEDKAEIRRLQKELRRAQQERDILKKAVAFFARESEDR